MPAHVLPPIGAQGLQYSGLRDIEAMIRVRGGGQRRRAATSAEEEDLRAYERARRADIALRTGAVDGLNRSLLSHFAALDFARGAGLATLSAVGPLRRLVHARRDRAPLGSPIALI